MIVVFLLKERSTFKVRPHQVSLVVHLSIRHFDSVAIWRLEGSCRDHLYCHFVTYTSRLTWNEVKKTCKFKPRIYNVYVTHHEKMTISSDLGNKRNQYAAIWSQVSLVRRWDVHLLICNFPFTKITSTLSNNKHQQTTRMNRTIKSFTCQ